MDSDAAQYVLMYFVLPVWARCRLRRRLQAAAFGGFGLDWRSAERSIFHHELNVTF
jgi:hypothetical protein